MYSLYVHVHTICICTHYMYTLYVHVHTIYTCTHYMYMYSLYVHVDQYTHHRYMYINIPSTYVHPLYVHMYICTSTICTCICTCICPLNVHMYTRYTMYVHVHVHNMSTICVCTHPLNGLTIIDTCTSESNISLPLYIWMSCGSSSKTLHISTRPFKLLRNIMYRFWAIQSNENPRGVRSSGRDISC